MAYAIKKGSDYFKAVTYTGTGASQDVNVGFSPDFTWIKNRSHNDADPYYGVHLLYDTIRGVGNRLISSSTTTEAFSGGALTSFNSDGYSVGTDNSVSYSCDSFISWNWKGGESTVVNTDGTITSNVSVNTTSGFSVVTYTGNGTSGATVGHGLGSTPKMIIIKNRTYGVNWRAYHASLGATKYLNFNLTNTVGTSSLPWNNTAPGSSVFTLGSEDNLNRNTDNMVAYCFAEVDGFSKISSYIGNGSSDGTFVYTGFRPAFVLFKNTNTAQNWIIMDTIRDPKNKMTQWLQPSSNAAEYTDGNIAVDFLSNGFKLRNLAGTELNGNGNEIIYMAFAETPFKFANAR